MSQKKPLFYDTLKNKNQTINYSSEFIRKFQSKISIQNKKGRYSTPLLIKQTESSLLNEDQSYYRFRYIMQDKADSSNIVFFDSISRKYRNRSSENIQKPKHFTDTYNKVSLTKVNKNNKKYYNRNENSFSRNRNEDNKYKRNNNEKNLIKTMNISNKINIIKIDEKNVKNTQSRAEIIKQLKKEKEELLGKNNLKRNSQQSNNNYYGNNNIYQNQKNISKNFQKGNINPIKNKYSPLNQRVPLQNKLQTINQKTPAKTNQKNSPNIKLYSNIQSSNKQENNKNNNNSNINTNKKMTISENRNKNPHMHTSERKEERIIILVPGQTIERNSMIENIENPKEELVENPDGTTSSIIKQTKVITMTENIPVKREKIKTIEGGPEFPIYKQHLTHIYKTITSVSPKVNKGDKILNKNFFKDNNYETTSDKTGNKINSKENKENNLNIEKGNYLYSSKIPKEIKNEKDDKEHFLGKTKNKGDNTSQYEKEKQFNSIKDSLNSILLGKNQHNNLEKLSQILANRNEKEKKEILEKLGKEPKYYNILKEFGDSMEKNVHKNNYKENSENVKSKDFSSNKNFKSGLKSLHSDNSDINEISPLKFDGFFLDMDKYGRGIKENNPFEGPSPYIELYKERMSLIKQKLINLSTSEFEQSEKTEQKLKK